MKQPDFGKRLYLKPCVDKDGDIRLYDPETGRVLGGQQDLGIDNVKPPEDEVMTANISVIIDPRFVNSNIKET